MPKIWFPRHVAFKSLKQNNLSIFTHKAHGNPYSEGRRHPSVQEVPRLYNLVKEARRGQMVIT